MNFRKYAFSFALVAATMMVGGCNDIGNAPKGMSGDDAKAAIERMSPEQKIKAIASSPMPPDEKQRQYAEIEAKTGVKASTVLANGPQGVTGTQSAN